MKRIFIAIDLPTEVKEALYSLRTNKPGVRWVGKDQMHITLLYLGKIRETIIDDVVQRLNKITQQPFEFRISGTGCFPDKKRPKVIYAAVSEKTGLMKLREKVEQEVGQFREKSDNRAYVPHITLARIKRRKGKFNPEEILSEKNEPLNVSIDSFYLYESLLSKDGATYKKLNRFNLVK